MALLDAYATAAQYSARTGDTSTNATLTSVLTGVTRLFEKSVRVAPGGFNTDGTDDVVYTFDGRGGTVLDLRDRSGLQYFLQSVAADGIGIDGEADGTFDEYSLDFADAWIRGLPENGGATTGEPFRRLELLSHLSTVNPAVWPRQRAAVQITGTWGWSAVPELVIDCVVHRTHEIMQSFKEGGLGFSPAFDSEVPMRSSTAWMWKEAERLYGAAGPRSFAV